jgi:Zn finger protein HypA/HybF involved in hydrogenase expression
MIQTPTENWFKFPNHIADNLQDYDPYELKILVFMLRRTVGMLGLTSTPDQRFSISFLAKNTKLSESQVSKSKKTMLQKGIIIEDGIADDGSKLYAVSWDVPSIERPPLSNRGTPSPQCGEPPLLNAETDKDSSLKTIEENTLDASASSAIPEKMNLELSPHPPYYWKCFKCNYVEKAHHKDSMFLKKICPKCNDEKVQMPLIGKEGIQKNKIAFEKEFQEYVDELPKIPFKEISDQFSKRHREFRKTEPIWNGPKETKGIKELWKIYGSKEKIFEAIEAFINYIKAGKGQYIDTAPILPAQIPPVANQILPYFKKNMPKLEIKKYEQTGIHIGPMPEGW